MKKEKNLKKNQKTLGLSEIRKNYKEAWNKIFKVKASVDWILARPKLWDEKQEAFSTKVVAPCVEWFNVNFSKTMLDDLDPLLFWVELVEKIVMDQGFAGVSKTWNALDDTFHKCIDTAKEAERKRFEHLSL
jgi:hypothetical protein